MYIPREEAQPVLTKAAGTGDMGLGAAFGEGIVAGIESGPSMAMLRQQAVANDTPQIMLGDTIIDNPAYHKTLSEDEFKALDLPEDIKYEPGMSDYRAKLLASVHDEKARQDYIDTHWHGVVPGTIKTLGSFAGTMLDPTMYLPVVGEAQQAAMAARIGKVAAGAVAGAATNAALVTAAQGLDLLTESQLQQDPDWRMAALNIGIATAAGATFGALTGWLSRVPDKTKATAAAKALDDLSAGRAVDVGPVLDSGGTDAAALDILRDSNSPRAAQEQALTSLGIDPNLTPEEIVQKISELPKQQPDFKVATPAPEISTAPEFTTEGPLGVAPEVQQHIEQRFADLEASDTTKGIAKEALDAVQAETEGWAARGKAMLAAALCLGRGAL